MLMSMMMMMMMMMTMITMMTRLLAPPPRPELGFGVGVDSVPPGSRVGAAFPP
jgi:hypothetical protein